MKKSYVIIIAVLVLVTGFVFINARNQPSSRSNASSFSSVQSDVSNGAKLYDVRTSQEYTSGHFANSENHSLQDMQAGKLPEVAKDTKIYVYCQSGNRSSQAVKILTDAGYANVSDLGGLQDVQANGGKLE